MVGLIGLLVLLGLIPVAIPPSAKSDPCHIVQADFEWRPNQAMLRCVANGNPRALAYLGMFYLAESNNDPPDPVSVGLPAGGTAAELEAEGWRLLERAAAGHNRIALNELGNAHLRGLYGRSQDDDLARHWLELSDEQGDDIAPYNLAMLYHTGRGVGASPQRTERLLWRSALRGYRPALCALAIYNAERGRTEEAILLNGVAILAPYGESCDDPDVRHDFPALRNNAQALDPAK